MADSNITKNALAAAMKELMQEKKFEKISVSDICDRCGMNRKSFYYHFRDKYDLVNWIFYVGFIGNINMSDYETDQEGTPANGPWKLYCDVTDYFYRERAFYKKALMIEGQNSFRDYFHDVIVPVVQYFLSDILDGEDFGDLFVQMLCDGFIDGLVLWLTSAHPEEPAKMRESIGSMMVKLARKIAGAKLPEQEEKKS